MSDFRPITPPGWLLATADVPRAWGEAFTLLMLRLWFDRLPKGDGHPVMVIPGFAGDDTYNRPLIGFLRRLGYHAVGWKQGRNLGHSTLDPQRLGMRLAKLYEHEGRKVTLIGHSLGGVFAREAARRHPERVRQVVSLGSPIGPDRAGASALNTVYEALNRHPGQLDEHLWHMAPPVPTTAVYSKTDGVLDWRVCMQSDGHEHTENIQIYGSHNGMTLNAMVWILLSERLGRAAGDWQPFRAGGLLRLMYPRPAWEAFEPLHPSHA